MLNLKENEIEQLATFLGHDIRVHGEFYRLPESTLQLFVSIGERETDLQGKGLDDIEINLEGKILSELHFVKLLTFRFYAFSLFNLG